MPGYVVTNFFIYAIVNAFTPGPGNILALNTVTNYGWKNGKRLFFGIFAGYYAVQIICAIFVYGVGTFLPNALHVMKYIGAAYILWLAIHIAVSKPEPAADTGSASFMKGFLLQFVNVKVMVSAIVSIQMFVLPYYQSTEALAAFAIFIAIAGTSCNLVWSGFGSVASRLFANHTKLINTILAISLVFCAAGFWF